MRVLHRRERGNGVIYEASGPQYYEYCRANTGERCLALSNERALIGLYCEHGNASFIGVYVRNMATRLRWVVLHIPGLCQCTFVIILNTAYRDIRVAFNSCGFSIKKKDSWKSSVIYFM